MKILKRVILFALMAAVLIACYMRLSSKNVQDVEPVVDDSEVGKILATDLELNYPPSPKDVVDFYSKIIKAYYGEEYTEEQLGQLANQARGLFDSELLSYNPYDNYMVSLQAEIASYKLNSKKISSYAIQKSADIDYLFDDGKQYARVDTLYYMMEGNSDRTKTYEQYTLRKDDDGNWKIVCWEVIDGKGFRGE